jgi:hypothetical protein
MKPDCSELATGRRAHQISHLQVLAAREKPAASISFGGAASGEFGKVLFAICFAILGLAAGQINARADIFAAVCVAAPEPRTDMDIAVMNASTGTRLPLPASVNTTGEEQNPGVTQDGRRLVFERRDAGNTRIIVVDLVTGASADLFTGFEIALSPQEYPAFTPGGTKVITSGPHVFRENSFTPQFAITDLQSFPTAPFPHSTQFFDTRVINPAQKVENLTVGGGNLLAFTVKNTFVGSHLLFLTKVGPGGLQGLFSRIFDNEEVFSGPAMAAKSPQFVLFEHRRDIMFRPAEISSFAGTPTKLPPLVNSPDGESQPAITADGRYVVFVRQYSSGVENDRLFVWDSQTQTLLNANGIDLGLINTRSRGGTVSIYSKLAIVNSTIILAGLQSNTLKATVTSNLTQTAKVGILIQRILGKTKVLGRKAYEVETVGRFPLGEFPEGRLRTTWDLTVDGQKLKPGRYLVTLRSVEDDVALELGRPRVLRIPKRKR